MQVDWAKELGQMLVALMYFVVGSGCFGLSIWVMDKLTPFSIRKEIEEDQNMSLGIVIGCALIGLSILLAAAIHGS